MVNYSTNWMGPISIRWYEDNNIPYEEVTKYNRILKKEVTFKNWKENWSGGRIDIRGVPGEPHGDEYGLPIMRTEDWNDFSDWLDGLDSEKVLSFENIVMLYELNSKTKIRWWKEYDT